MGKAGCTSPRGAGCGCTTPDRLGASRGRWREANTTHPLAGLVTLVAAPASPVASPASPVANPALPVASPALPVASPDAWARIPN